MRYQASGVVPTEVSLSDQPKRLSMTSRFVSDTVRNVFNVTIEYAIRSCDYVIIALNGS